MFRTGHMLKDKDKFEESLRRYDALMESKKFQKMTELEQVY